MAALQKISNHIEEALARLIFQFRDKPNIENLIRAFTIEIQTLEDVFEMILKYRWVDTAIGAQLDGMGSIVGETRRGRNDDDYRLAIRLRIAINTCKGTPEEFITIFLLITGCTHAFYQPIYPAQVMIMGDKDFSFTLIGGDDAFAFEGGPDGLGFSDVFDPTIGGKYATLQLTDMDYLFYVLQSCLPAGVLLGPLGWYDGPNGFSFDGGPDGGGYGDLFDDTIGGKFATLYS